jgi:hypothetical protein
MQLGPAAQAAGPVIAVQHLDKQLYFFYLHR